MIKKFRSFNEMAKIDKIKDKLYVDNELLKNISLENISNNIATMYCKDSNFLYPKGYTMVWFFDDNKYIKDFSNGKENLLYFPLRRVGNMNISPISDLWLKNKGNQKHIIGVIEGFCHDDKIIIKMMSVRPGFKRNGVNKIMIDSLVKDFPNAKLYFDKPTEDGEKFIDKYFPNSEKII